jgi:hypothetical protein
MVAAIILLALAMFVAGGASIYNALNLVPTDFGFAYAQIGAIFIASGGVTLAIALAVRAMTSRLGRFAAPVASILPERPAGTVAMETPRAGRKADPAPPEPAREAPEPILARARPTNAALAGSTGLSAGIAAAHTAGRPGDEDDLSASPASRREDEKDRQIPALGVGPATDPADWQPATWQPATRIASGHELFAEFDRRMPVVTPTELDAEALPERSPDDAVPGGDEPMEPDDLPVRSFPAEGQEEGDRREAEEDTVPPEEGAQGDTFAGSGDGAEPGTGSDDGEVIPPASVEPLDEDQAAPAGLIPDADLDWLAGIAEPPLAPLESLEIVGSYDSAGTRFTMYSDGSVTASGERGERRFRSLEELRQHLDRNVASSG